MVSLDQQSVWAGLGPRITAFPDSTTQVTSGNAATVNATTTNAGLAALGTATARRTAPATPPAARPPGRRPGSSARHAVGPGPTPPSRARATTAVHAPARTAFDGTYTITGQALRRPRHRRRLARLRAAAQPVAADHRDRLPGRPQLQRRPARVPLEPEPGAGHRRLSASHQLGADNQIGNGNDTLICSDGETSTTTELRRIGLDALDRHDLRRRRARPHDDHRHRERSARSR